MAGIGKYASIEEFMNNVIKDNPAQEEFHQAVEEVVASLWDFLEENPIYFGENILDRIVEPERVISFRVPWRDDKNQIHVNRGYRVEFNSAIGPYKGGLRFHPSVNLGSLKFLGFEQTFKNSLTSLQMGGGKGGANFDPKGKSDHEIMSFCQSFMQELFKHIGPETDVPAGDIGVGSKELGYLFGMYKKLKNEFTGVLTGKGLNWGGSLIRPEATGFGAIYFVKEMLSRINEDIEGKTISVSGFGNVAWGAVLKATELGAKVVTLSGPDGYIYDPDGVKGEKIEYMLKLRATNNDVVEPYADKYDVEFFPGKRPWERDVDIAIPCAIQNELDGDDAQQLIDNNVTLVAEASNMGCTKEAVDLFHENQIPFGPGKAVNAGGVAVSGLEMSQNSMKLKWSREEVDSKLHNIMTNIHSTCVEYGEDGDFVDYVKGANIGGFIKVADAMIEQGVV